MTKVHFSFTTTILSFSAVSTRGIHLIQLLHSSRAHEMQEDYYIFEFITVSSQFRSFILLSAT